MIGGQHHLEAAVEAAEEVSHQHDAESVGFTRHVPPGTMLCEACVLPTKNVISSPGNHLEAVVEAVIRGESSSHNPNTWLKTSSTAVELVFSH